MKYVSLLSICALFMMAGCQQPTPSVEAAIIPVPANPIEGAWELIQEGTGKVVQLKVFSRDHFAYVHLSDEGTIAGSSAGHYRLEGDRYIETHLYGSEDTSDRVPATFVWNFEVRGDSLLISGPLSCVDRDGNSMEDLFGMCTEGNGISETRIRARTPGM
ncbi:MAG: hypothetical protein R2834_03785 [Rhodothermales bacterium]